MLGARRLNGVDITKFILVFFIVAIHASTVNDTASYVLVNGICRIAVPYYFIVSGYFCFRKACNNGELNSSYVFSYLKRIFSLYVIWTLIYMPVIVQGMIADNPKGHGAIYIALRWFIVQFLFTGSYFHLWYINATLIGVLITFFLLRLKLKPKIILLIAFIFYGIGLLGQSYNGLIAGSKFEILFDYYCKIFISTRNGLFIGFPLIAIGMYISQKSKNSSPGLLFALFLISIVLLVLEVLFTAAHFSPLDYNAYLLLPVSAVLLFLISVKAEISNNGIYRSLRDIGVLMFFSHMYILRVIDQIIVKNLCSSTVDTFNPLARYFVVIFFTLTISLSIYFLSKKVNIIKKLY